jgi:hypothetical protein
MEGQSCPHHAHPHAHSRWLPRLDAFGSAAAIICAVHCAFLPIAAVAMPLAAVEVLGNHRFELGFVIFALVFGAAVLSSGLSRSRQTLVLGLYVAAALLLLSGVALHESALQHALLMVSGGLSLGAAHAINRHFVRANNDAQSLWMLSKPATIVDSAGSGH